MNLELNHYGVCLDSDWFYIALNWKVLTLIGVVYLARLFYLKRVK